MAGHARVTWRPDLFVLSIIGVIVGLICLIRFVIDLIFIGPYRMLSIKKRLIRPEILTKSTFGSHEFIRLPNSRITLHCVVNGPSDKPLMLFVHGFPEFWYSWRHQLLEFSKDYRVVAFDMRGYGESSKPSGVYEYTIDKLIYDLDQLITHLGYEKCILVAHDWGALVAWAYASVYPSKVDRLVIANCPHPVAGEQYFKSGAMSQLLKSWYVFFFQVPFFPEFFMRANDLRFVDYLLRGSTTGAKPDTFTQEDIEAFKYTFYDFGDLAGPIDYYRAMVRFIDPEVDAALRKQITVPTLIIWGTNDGALDRQFAEWNRRFVEHCTIHYVEGASHWVQQEEPVQFNMLLRQFLVNGF